MAKVRKVINAKTCKCGAEPEVCAHLDNDDNPTKCAVWIECECGMLTSSFTSKDLHTAKNKAIKNWNSSARRRKIKGGLRTCEKCGSDDVSLLVFEHCAKLNNNISYMVRCAACGLTVEEMDNEGNLRPEKEVKEIWNL